MMTKNLKDWHVWALVTLWALALYYVWNRANPAPLVSDLAWQQYDSAAQAALDAP